MEKLGLYFILMSLFGLVVCWIASKEFFGKQSIDKIKNLNSAISEKEICLRNLERDCAEKRNQLERLMDESLVCKHKLLEKSNLLRKKIDELYKVQEELDNINKKITKVKEVEKKNKELLNYILKSKKIDNQNIDKEFNSQELQRLRAIIIEKDKIISRLRKEYSEKLLVRRNSYIEISKDQFYQIEKRLKEYKHRADILEYENSRLDTFRNNKKESDFFDKINYSISNLKEVALLNLFKDNYEKIPKA